jgi:hypothetical protein
MADSAPDRWLSGDDARRLPRKILIKLIQNPPCARKKIGVRPDSVWSSGASSSPVRTVPKAKRQIRRQRLVVRPIRAKPTAANWSKRSRRSHGSNRQRGGTTRTPRPTAPASRDAAESRSTGCGSSSRLLNHLHQGVDRDAVTLGPAVVAGPAAQHRHGLRRAERCVVPGNRLDRVAVLVEPIHQRTTQLHPGRRIMTRQESFE